MPDAMDFQPFVGQAFVDRHSFANAIDEDFAAAAGQAAQASLLEPAKHFPKRHLVDLVKMPDFRRTEGVQIDLWKARLEIAEQFLIPFELETRMQAALHQDLIAAQRDR